MSAMAKEMPLFLAVTQEALAEREEAESQCQAQDLAERYSRAVWYERLCLWLEFRDARPQMDELEAALIRSHQPAEQRGLWQRLLNLPPV